ncbi:MAG: type II secretion system F family protein [Acetobacteraceae bacterium]
MTSGLSWLLVVLSFLSLLGFGVSGLMVSQMQGRNQVRAQRIRDIVTPYRQRRSTDLATFRPATVNNRSLTEMVTGAFGFHPTKLDQYSAPWWAVVGVTFVIARVAGGFLVDVVGSLGWIGVPIAWVMMSRFVFRWMVRRRQTALLHQFPDALATIVRAVRVGIPVLGTIVSISREAPVPTSIEFTKFANQLDVGVPLDQAVTEMAERNDLAEYRFFATAIALQAQTGGGLSETLENLADLIRKRLALQERGQALTSEARTSSLILAALPVVMGAGLYALNPAYISVLFNTDSGRVILGAAVLSLACGAMTMRTIIKKSLS